MSHDDLSVVGQTLEALFIAGRAIKFMPELPKHMKPSHIRVLDIIYKIQSESGTVRVTDVSTAMQITKPSITRLIQELVDLGAVKKSESVTDKRVVLVELSSFGEECVRKYILNYHGKLAKSFSELDREKYLSMIETINFVYQAMKDVSEENS